MANKLGVQSYCFRDFTDNTTAADMVRQLGLGVIELCNVHVDFQDTAAHEPTLAAYRGKGVQVASAGVNRITGDEKADRNCFDFLKAASAKYMSVDFLLDGLDAALGSAEKLAEEYDVFLGIHNHGGRHWLGSAQALSYVFGRTSRRIGLCLDTAWAMHAHEDPLAWVDQFSDRLHTLHLKDFTFDRAGEHEDVVIGTGNLDLEELDRRIAGGGFSGHAILEYEGDPADPVPAITKCVDAVKRHMPSIEV